MKKFLFSLVTVITAFSVHSATVGWSMTRTDATYKGDAYQLFVIGQNGVESVDAIKLLLDAGTDVSDYAFAEGKLTTSVGGITIQPGSSGKTLAGADPAIAYTAFFVVYDSETVTVGSTKYITISGAADLTQQVGTSTASIQFKAGNQATAVSNPDNWASFGSDPVPEPTTVALLALGLAAVGLKRKVA